jgi:hypothetical protein
MPPYDRAVTDVNLAVRVDGVIGDQVDRPREGHVVSDADTAGTLYHRSRHEFRELQVLSYLRTLAAKELGAVPPHQPVSVPGKFLVEPADPSWGEYGLFQPFQQHMRPFQA